MRQPLQVLFVEDDPQDAELVLRELRRAGFDPTGPRVDTEEEFLRHLHAGLDIILSDYAMPQFSGLRALELLNKKGLEVPFILVSGTIGEETAVMAMKVGAADYLLKDRLARLGPAVTQALDQARSWRERRQAERALRESEERFRQLADTINEVFWMSDPARQTILYVSPAFEKIWGRTCASLYLSPDSWSAAIHVEDRSRVLVAVATRQGRGDFDETYRIVRPDGAIRWVRDRAFPVCDAAGEVFRIAGVAEDVTERNRLEEQFRQAQKMEAVGQLAGGVAHDFNNLLTVILMRASLMEHDLSDPAALIEGVREIRDAGTRAANLTRQLLMFSRRQTMQVRRIDVNAVIAGVLRLIRRIVGEHITINFRDDSGALSIDGDAGMLEQVIMNLLVNARDAMPEGGGVTIVTEPVENPVETNGTSPTRAGSFVRLTISDTGTGIPPDVLPRIFEPFFTTKEVGKGTGLGLATVYGIIEQHHGWIEVSSVLGQGTTFAIHLPLIAATVTAAQENGKTREAGGGSETILLVEDEAPVRALVKQVLKLYGYRVLEAEHAAAALEIWKRHRDEIKLLFTDVVLPGGMSGGQLAQRLRTEQPALKVIYSSGYKERMVGEQFTPGDGEDFLAKPYELDQLAAIVRRSLDRPAAKKV